MQPAIRHAARGFTVTPYLADCIGDAEPDFRNDPGLAARFLPGGRKLQAGDRLVQGDTAETLELIARDGPDALLTGSIGAAVVECIQARGGLLTREDITAFHVIEREPVRGSYRGFEIVGPPPPASSGVHILQMLNILEGFDVAALGFGTPQTLHLLAEVLKIAFADRAVATADPAFVDVPVARLIDKAYAAERRALIDMARAKTWSAGVSPGLSGHTTHLTVADGFGNVVATTQTINSLFGARFLVPGVGVDPEQLHEQLRPAPRAYGSVHRRPASACRPRCHR